MATASAQASSTKKKTVATKPKAAAAKPKAAAPKKPAPRKAQGGIAAPVTPSPQLAEIVGKDKLSRGEAVKQVWAYIKKHDLQNPKNKREILADDKLKEVFGGPKATMFEMSGHLAKHLKA